MSNKNDNYNQEHHAGKGGSRNGNNSYRSAQPHQPAEYRNEQEDEIDLIELVKHFWRDRKVIAKITGAFVIIGIIIALFSAVEYKADAVLMPESQSSQSRAQSLLSRYGGLLGIGGGSNASGSTISPKLYPKIVESVPYNLQLMNVPITFSDYDTTVTTSYFFHRLYSPSLLGYVKRYTIGLPGVISGLFKSDQQAHEQLSSQLDIQTMERDTVFNLTRRQLSTVKLLKGRVNVQVDQQSGLVTLSAEMPDPMAAAGLAKASIRILTKYVKEYRTKKAVQNLEFIQGQVKKAKQKFDKAQHQLAEFHDNNLSITSARSKTKEQDLQSAYNLAFNLYNSLQQQLQQAKLRVQMQTPVVSILQPVMVPKAKSEPNRKLIVVVFLILGVIVALGWSLIRDYGREIIQEVKAEETPDDEKSVPVPPTKTDS